MEFSKSDKCKSHKVDADLNVSAIYNGIVIPENKNLSNLQNNSATNLLEKKIPIIPRQRNQNLLSAMMEQAELDILTKGERQM